ncbi:hypothetical protein N9E40_04320, partial [Amylibacter sp.]|nr:hypothetical protein [Amylibacter sp.]
MDSFLYSSCNAVWACCYIFLPIFLAFTAVFMATNVPPANWPNSYNLGGFSGDAIFEVIIDFNPIDLAIWVKAVSISLGLI